jgi:hypothetical protein
MKFLATIVRYLHYTIGITTPRPEQERTFVLIWIAAILFIVGGSVAFFFILLQAIHSR